MLQVISFLFFSFIRSSLGKGEQRMIFLRRNISIFEIFNGGQVNANKDRQCIFYTALILFCLDS